MCMFEQLIKKIPFRIRHSDYRDGRRSYNSSPPPVSYGRRTEIAYPTLDAEDYRGSRDWPRGGSSGDRERRGAWRDDDRHPRGSDGSAEANKKLFVKNVSQFEERA